MSNHVHLVVIPHQSTSLGLACKQTHGRYAAYWNAGHKSSGHAWHGRFYSCPTDPSHLWAALPPQQAKSRLAGDPAALHGA